MRVVFFDHSSKKEAYITVRDNATSVEQLMDDLCLATAGKDDGLLCVLREGPDIEPFLRKPALLALRSQEDIATIREDDTLVFMPIGSDLPPSLHKYPPNAMATLAHAPVESSTAPCFEITTLGAAGVQQAMIAAMMAHGHFYVELPAERFAQVRRCNDVAEDFFTNVPYRDGKWLMPMNPDDRTWGWHCMHNKQKEILKLRDVPSMRRDWPEALVPFAPFGDCIDALRSAAEEICTALVAGAGVDPVVFQDAISRTNPSRPTVHLRDEFAASFYESFRYAPFPASKAGGHGFYVPCEMHQDVGIVTVSMRAKGPRGLQLLCPSSKLWVDAEGPMDGQQPRVVVFAGDSLAHVSRGRIRPTQHRVVLPTTQRRGDDDPVRCASRYSTIYEVLIHPQAVVPQVPMQPQAEEVTSCSEGLTGRDVFVLSSIGKSSINWK
jgi:hypothetical protein